MFGGIVAGLGRVLGIGAVPGAATRLEVDVSVLPRPVATGESVSVSGVCLTVVDCVEGRATFDVIGQTVQLTTLGDLQVGDEVNLEAALRVGDPVGGHEVQGHVDSVGVVSSVDVRDDETWTTVRCDPEVHRTLVPRGWVAVDGVSLTVADLGDADFSVALIPTTLELTTLGRARPGTRVNLEGDPLGRHVWRWMEARAVHSGDGPALLSSTKSNRAVARRE